MKYLLMTSLFSLITVSTQVLAETKTQPKKQKTPPAPVASPIQVAPSPEPVPAPMTTPTPEATSPEPQAQAPEKPTETTAVASSEESGGDGYGKTQGIAGPVVFGPVITAIGVPSPFRLGLDARGFNYFGMGVDYGFLPTLDFSSVKIKYNSWRILARIFPFKGAFFLGVGFGKQTLTGSSSNTVQTVAVNYSIELSTTILAPHIGWRWTGKSGFFYGIELGVQLASSSVSTFSSDAPAALQADATYLAEKAKVEDEARKLGNTTLPHFALIQLGYLF